MEMGGHLHGIHYRFLKISKQHASIMALVERLRKVAHFIAVKYTNSDSEVA